MTNGGGTGSTCDRNDKSLRKRSTSKRSKSMSKRKEGSIFKQTDDFQDQVKQRVQDVAMNERGYKYGTGNFDAYMEIGQKMVSHGRHLKTSIDSIRKPEALIFGYVLRDFPIYETILLHSDEINHGVIDRMKKYYMPKPEKLVILKQQKLSFEPKDNIRIWRQLRFHIEKS